MKVFQKVLERDEKECYAITARFRVDVKDTYTLDVVDEEEVSITEETNSLMNAILIMIGIDYAAEKELKSTIMVDGPGDYFYEYYCKLFDVMLPCEEGDNRYIDYKAVRIEQGQEAFEIILDKNDPIVAMVRSVCDGIMEEYESIDEGDIGRSYSSDFLDRFQDVVNKLEYEEIEIETIN
ncbi:MAG: hypothetical protein K6D97_04920 [Clostridia bacterium]|nr:hypothetical protein [Clostridia bacterium]